MYKIFNTNDSDAVDFASKMIVFNPKKRMTIEECLNHKYITSIKDNSVSDPKYIGKLDFEFENLDQSKILFLIDYLENEIKSFESGFSILIN